MTVKLTLEFESLPDMLGFFANTKTLANVETTTTVTVAEAEQVALPKRGPGRPKKIAVQAQPEVAQNTGSVASVPSTDVPPLTEGDTGSTAVEAKEVAGNGAGETEASAAPVTADDARMALTDLNGRLGLEAAKKALAKFKANRLSELQASDYAAFVAYCKGAE